MTFSIRIPIHDPSANQCDEGTIVQAVLDYFRQKFKYRLHKNRIIRWLVRSPGYVFIDQADWQEDAIKLPKKILRRWKMTPDATEEIKPPEVCGEAINHFVWGMFSLRPDGAVIRLGSSFAPLSGFGFDAEYYRNGNAIILTNLTNGWRS